MSDIPPGEGFEITHDSKMLELQGKPLCCIVDPDPEHASICEEMTTSGFDYNLKGLIMKTPQGHAMGCRFIVKNEKHFLDYHVKPSNEWITELRKSKRLAIIKPSGMTMMITDDLWIGDIEDVLHRFYSSNESSNLS